MYSIGETRLVCACGVILRDVSSRVLMLLASARALAAGMLLCDVPTPALLVDHSTAAAWRGLSPDALDAALNAASSDSLADMLYIHTAGTFTPRAHGCLRRGMVWCGLGSMLK